jgi:hypothetical protein
MEVALARVNRSPDVPASLPEPWQVLLRAMTMRDPAQRPNAATVAESLRRIAAGEELDRTVAMTQPVPSTSTQVLPASAVATQAAAWPPATPATAAPAAAAARPSRTGPSAAVIVTILLLVAAAIAVAIIAVQRNNNSGTTTNFTPGQPRLHPAKVERDMRDLERLVHR